MVWRPYQREIVAQGTIDIDVHEHSAQIRQVLSFPRDRSSTGAEAKDAPIQLRVPRGIDKVTVYARGEKVDHDRIGQILSVRASPESADKVDLVLQYDLPVTKKLLHVTPIWPMTASQMDVKVRIWSPAGVVPRLSSDLLNRGVWKERSVELVPDKAQFPALVLAGYGSNLPLSVEIEEAGPSTLAAFLADRALIQVRMGEDGSQEVRARYLIRKIHAAHIDVELPLPKPRFRDPPKFTFGRDLNYTPLDAKTEKVVRVKLPPDLVALPAILEISYTIPADGLEGNRFWSTVLHAPIFRSDVVIGQMRWQLTEPKPMIAASLGRRVRADVQWSLQGWLVAPEPAVTSADLDEWLTTEKAPQPAANVSFAFSHVSLTPETVYHLPRQWWLLGCSGVFLIVTLGAYFTPLPRWTFWLLLVTLGIAGLALGIFCPAALPPILFGMQPGLVLLLVFIGIHWLLQERYRRQLVFLPGFTRAKPSSTMVRTNSAKHPREASTVDAPPAAAEGSVPKASGSQAGT